MSMLQQQTIEDYRRMRAEAEVRMPTIRIAVGDYTVELDRPCLTCGGSAVMAAPAIAEWHRLHLGGWLDALRDGNRAAFEREHPLPEEDVEEIACRACNGAGAILTPEGFSVMNLVKRHWR